MMIMVRAKPDVALRQEYKRPREDVHRLGTVHPLGSMNPTPSLLPIGVRAGHPAVSTGASPPTRIWCGPHWGRTRHLKFPRVLF
jgi:hypothetical protein